MNKDGLIDTITRELAKSDHPVDQTRAYNEARHVLKVIQRHFAIVPREPTEGMHSLVDESGEPYPHHCLYGVDKDEFIRTYKAMIKAGEIN